MKIEVSPQVRFTKKYKRVTAEKAGGETYTPIILADFVARQMVQTAQDLPTDRPIRILDPAIGDGELILSLLGQLHVNPSLNIEVFGFDKNEKSLAIAEARIQQQYSSVAVNVEVGNFLEHVVENFGQSGQHSLFTSKNAPKTYDLVIANPPYVRTQIIGTSESRMLAAQFGLTGRVDLYHAFILAITQVLDPRGVAGIIVSNRFMTTKAGASVRQAFLNQLNACHVWDLGDTKLFDAAVLPSVLLAKGKSGCKVDTPAFTSIYTTKDPAQDSAEDVIGALSKVGNIAIDDGRCFRVQNGKLSTSGTPDGVWRISTEAGDSWLANVNSRTWGTFRDVGKIRVGVKTCADNVFIRSDWQELPETDQAELLKPVMTHYVARRFKPHAPEVSKQILYPHEVSMGKRHAIDLSLFPRSKTYLERHRPQLESRSYVMEAGREWYEIWVPQDPDAWEKDKLVFRDISEEPTFWIDKKSSVVNGDCYWLICQDASDNDLLWLAAAVGNSTFIERFYDYSFNNKLYAGRRRFMTQYVEKFPLPDPKSALGMAIICKSKEIYEAIPSSEVETLQIELNDMVWEALTGSKVS